MVQHTFVTGRVQGVGFRWYIQREAAELGLHGWVRNTDDGAVEILASGSDEQLEELREAIQRGSRGSRVDRITQHELDPAESHGLGPFTIQGAW